jgi:3-oxoacyl-[acyl-carrier-protein] synthase III
MILDIESFLPTGRLDNVTLARELERWTPEEIFRKTGIQTRSIAREDETVVDLSASAASALLSRHSGRRIDFLILCTQTGDYKTPCSASILHGRLGLPQSCGAFDIGLACSGYIYGLALSRALLSSGMAQSVLLLNGDTYTHYIHPKDHICRPLFGDGAAATLLTADSGVRLVEFELGSEGKEALKMLIPAGGERRRKFNITSESSPQDPEFLQMDGPEIYNFTLRAVPNAVAACMAKAGCSIADIDFFVFHQANGYMLEALRRKIGIPTQKFPVCLECTGNLVSASIPVVLAQMRRAGQIHHGVRTLLCGFGIGLSWGACIIDW